MFVYPTKRSDVGLKMRFTFLGVSIIMEKSA